MEKHGVEHQMHLQATKDKIKETCLDRYGVTNYTKTDECKIKIKQTFLSNYGVEHDNKTDEGQLRRKETRISKGNQSPDHLIEPYKLYRKRVDNILDRLRLEIIKDWDGYDYYDGEYIKDNFSLYKSGDRLYPTIDHKISVYYGFINNIPLEEIGGKENLCITKSHINSQKRDLNESEYIDKYEIKKHS